MSDEMRPYVWGFIGTAIALVLVLVTQMNGNVVTMLSPLAGGFFTGWLFGNLRNWWANRR
jgi:hypothetical protein